MLDVNNLEGLFNNQSSKSRKHINKLLFFILIMDKMYLFNLRSESVINKIIFKFLYLEKI